MTLSTAKANRQVRVRENTDLRISQACIHPENEKILKLLVRVRVELTILSLSAPRSAD